MNKVKDYVFVSYITFIVIILLLIVNLFIFKSPYVELTTPERVVKDFKVLKNEINKLDNSECKDELLKLANEYLESSFDGKVKMNDLYDFISTENVVKYYRDLNTKCNFTEEELLKYDITNNYQNKLLSQDKIISAYLYQYELMFTDEMSLPYDKGMSTYAYKILKYNEVEIIKDYLKMLGER